MAVNNVYLDITVGGQLNEWVCVLDLTLQFVQPFVYLCRTGNIIFRRANISIEPATPSSVRRCTKWFRLINTYGHSYHSTDSEKNHSEHVALICGTLWYHLITSYSTNPGIVCVLCVLCKVHILNECFCGRKHITNVCMDVCACAADSMYYFVALNWQGALKFDNIYISQAHHSHTTSTADTMINPIQLKAMHTHE